MFRFVEERSFVANALVNPVKVFLNRFISHIIISVHGSIDNTTVTAITPGAPYNLIRNASLIINGDTFKTISFGHLLHYLNAYQMETPGLTDPLAIADNAQDFSFDLCIPCSDLRAIAEGNYGVRDATLLPANASFINSIDLQWQWGASTDLLDGTNNAMSATARVLLEERADMGLVSDPRTLQVSHLQSFQEVWTAANSDLRVDIPLSGRLARLGILIDSDGAHSDTHVNKLSIEKQGVPVWGPVTWNELREKNKRDYGVENLIEGFGIIDFDPLGYLKTKDLILAASLNSLKLVLDVAAPTTTQARCRVLSVPYKSIAV